MCLSIRGVCDHSSLTYIVGVNTWAFFLMSTRSLHITNLRHYENLCCVFCGAPCGIQCKGTGQDPRNHQILGNHKWIGTLIHGPSCDWGIFLFMGGFLFFLLIFIHSPWNSICAGISNTIKFEEIWLDSVGGVPCVLRVVTMVAS